MMTSSAADIRLLTRTWLKFIVSCRLPNSRVAEPAADRRPAVRISGTVVRKQLLELVLARRELQRRALVVRIAEDDDILRTRRKRDHFAALVDQLFVLVRGLHSPFVEALVTITRHAEIVICGGPHRV